jgi:diguanylate cyclase (GGDEF)-like protein
MNEHELELSYRKRANRAVLFCVAIFCTSRIIAELLSEGSQLRDVTEMAVGACIAIILLLFLQRTNLKILSFIIPFSMYAIYLISSYAIDSYKYLYSVYLIALIIGTAYFSIRNYLAFIIVTQIINLLLSIFVLDGHPSISGNIWMHFAIILVGSFMLLLVLHYAISKSNEIDRAFASFGALMRVTPSALILVDKDNEIKYLSQSVTKVLNIKEPKNFIDKNFLELFEEDSVKELLKDIAEKRSFYENYQKITVNEQVKTFDVFADKMSGDATSGMFFMLNDVSEIVRLKELAEQDSLMDSLIQIPNRRAFDRRISQEWNYALRDKVNLSFLMIDIDFFKKYNDTYGHRQGDELLKTAGKIFKSSLKRSTDFIARLGGEEFGALLHATNSYQANVTAERIRKSVENQVILTATGEKTNFTVSIGVASVIPNINMEYSFLVEEADKALYKAKQNGRNRIWVIDLA